MRPFNLEAAKQHHPIQTRSGAPAKFLMYVPEAKEAYRVVALVNGEIQPYDEGGIYYSDGEESQLDLLMAPVGQIEGRDVYPDDELYNKIVEEWVKVIDVKGTGLYVYSLDGEKYYTPTQNLTWTKPKTKRVGWVNVYPDFDDIMHSSEDAADRKASSDRIACVPVEYEF